MTLIEAMKQALEALEELHRTGDTQVFDLCYAPKVIPALRTAIAEAEKQEPVAWVGLTEKDFSAINQSCLTKLQAATSAESILKEKNHG
jgi:hypothetical protein